MSGEQRYRIGQQDESGDWFVFPADMQNEFDAWEGGDPWPEWVQIVPGYPAALLTFTDPMIDA